MTLTGIEMAGGKASAAKVKLAERRQRAMELRKAGATFRAIAEMVANEFAEFPKYNPSMAAKDVRYLLDELNAQALEDAETMRRMETERLDLATLAIAMQVQAGNLQAIDRWIKLSDARAKLWGLYLPPAERLIQQETATAIELEIITDDSENNDEEIEGEQIDE
jgi:hypothetical protein